MIKQNHVKYSRRHVHTVASRSFVRSFPPCHRRHRFNDSHRVPSPYAYTTDRCLWTSSLIRTGLETMGNGRYFPRHSAGIGVRSRAILNIEKET